MSGLEIIRAIQSIHSEMLDSIFLRITDLHHEMVYLLILPMLLWLLDKRFARYLVSVFLLGFWANDLLKDFFHTARPSPDDVRVVRPEPSGAFPSGHAQNPLMFWGAMALYLRRTWFTVAAGVVIFAIGLSRLYLGVHWPLDVLGGWAIGAVMLLGFEFSQSFWLGTGMSFGRKLMWAVIIPLGAFGVSVASGQLGAPANQVAMTAGAYLGFWVGSVLEEEFVGFEPRAGGLGVQVAKILIGVVFMLAIKEGFKLFLPHNDLGNLIRYASVAFSATFISPWLFRRFLAAPPAGRSLYR
ncbi:MAG TPA: phosphatase PAP2 family protein [Symbiobacteriaceae bacterium]|nr:phosphatase PAP2 family protein [Symbiobacteriaceae bacterium]